MGDPAISACTDLQVFQHFRAIQTLLESNYKKTDATEGTGEAAAAYCIIKDPAYAGYRMRWGMHVHSGPGIDQIWYKPGPVGNGRRNGSYLIVEAKGVGAMVGSTPWDVPPAIQNQMSIGWVYDRLMRMVHAGHQEAVDLCTDVDLDELPPILVRATNRQYYRCQYKGTATSAQLLGLVIEATWGQRGEFSYNIVEEFNYHV